MCGQFPGNVLGIFRHFRFDLVGLRGALTSVVWRGFDAIGFEADSFLKSLAGGLCRQRASSFFLYSLRRT
jgi:hypothetical protein